jgi:hypothetical protein
MTQINNQPLLVQIVRIISLFMFLILIPIMIFLIFFTPFGLVLACATLQAIPFLFAILLFRFIMC